MTHEQLWAPWRLEYIISDKRMPEPDKSLEMLPGADRTCFLCQCVPEQDDRQRLVIFRSQHSLTVLNRYPYNNGHLLIAPLEHLSRIDQLDDQQQVDLTRTIDLMIGLLEKTMRPQGFNVGLNLGQAAGAGLPEHLHWHVVPRWVGDTNFMPAIAGPNVIPQSLDALWEMLAGELGKSDRGSDE